MKKPTLPTCATVHSSLRRVAFSLLALLPTLAASSALGATAQTTLVERDLPEPFDVGTDAAPIDDLDGDNLRDILIWSRGKVDGQPTSGVFTVQVLSGLTLEFIRAYPVPATWNRSMGATPVADRDGDGLQDIAIHSGALLPDFGEVRIVSSATGQLLALFDGTLTHTSFGGDVLDLGDVDGDGVSDLAVSAPERPGVLRSGIVEVISGADGSYIYQFSPPNISTERTGEFLSPLGDLNGDGIADFAASFADGLAPGRPFGYYAVSGADGTRIWTAVGGITYGRTIAILDDMNGDGVHELASVRSGLCFTSAALARASVLSGATGTALYAFNAPGGALPCDDLSVARTDDLDGDGLADLAIAQRYAGRDPGVSSRVALISSVTGASLGAIEGRPEANYGFSIAAAADINEDGVSELIVGGSAPPSGLGSFPGSVSILSPIGTIPLALSEGDIQFDGSTGTHTTIGAFGSPVAADNDVTLFARNMPPGSFGYFLVTPNAGGAFLSSAGFIFGGPWGRFVGPGQIRSADATGRFTLQVDLTQWPTAAGFTSVLAGDTWYFQSWNRDSFGGVVGSRLSDRLQIDFE